MPNLTTEEKLTLSSVLFCAKSAAFGESKLTDDNLFGEIAFEAEQKYERIESITRKLRSAKIL